MLAVAASAPAPAVSHKRRRGLWKRRRHGSQPPEKATSTHAHARSAAARPDRPSPSLHHHRPPSPQPQGHDRHSPGPDDFDDCDDTDTRPSRSSSTCSSKRRRFSGPWDIPPVCQSGSASSSSASARDTSLSPPSYPHLCPFSPSRDCTPLPDAPPARYAPFSPSRLSVASMPYSLPPAYYPTRPYVNMSFPGAEHGLYGYAGYGAGATQSAPHVELEDWANVSALFARAIERYDSDDFDEALPLLRAVVRECARLLTAHLGPAAYIPPHSSHSVVNGSRVRSFSRSPSPFSKPRSGSTPTHSDSPPRYVRSPFSPASSSGSGSTGVCTGFGRPAVHFLLARALSLLGSALTAVPSAALPGEPGPAGCWLAALEAFEEGEAHALEDGYGDDHGPGCAAGIDLGNSGGVFGSGSIGSKRKPCTCGGGLAEEWRVAVAWGRTLVCIAEEKVACALRAAKARQQQGSNSDPSINISPTSLSRSPSPTSSFPMSISLPPSTAPSSPPLEAFPLREPTYAPGSPFAAIAALRPPHVPRRAALHSASAHEVLVLAMDQFARGIFKMPHAQARPHSHSHFISHPHPHSHSHSHSHVHYQPFSRAAQLFSIATSILGVAERLTIATQRAHWAQQADSVLAQMRMEGLEAGVRVHEHAFPHFHPHSNSHSPSHSPHAGPVDGAGWGEEDWRGAVAGARGRCWLVVGAARGEGCEQALEQGANPEQVLHTPEAADAREALGSAITFFERAKGAAASPAEEAEISPLIAEALLTLANMTPDENSREELYARAQAEAGEGFPLGLELPTPAMATLAIGVSNDVDVIPQAEVPVEGEDERMDMS